MVRLGGDEHVHVLLGRKPRGGGVEANILQHQPVQRLPADGVGGAAGFSIIFIDPAGETGVSLLLGIVAHVQRGTAVSALDQTREGLHLAAGVFPPLGLHHLMHRVPQHLRDERLMGAGHNDPLFLRRRDAGFIKEALGFCPAKHRLAQVDVVVQNSPDGGGVPVEGLTPVVTVFVVVRIVLVEIGLGIEYAALPQNLRHAHIPDAVREHLEDVPHHIGGGRIDQQMVAVSRIFQVAKGRSAAKIHTGLRPRPMRRFGLAGCLAGI